MKILVPTDFSNNADHALEIAIQVANLLGGTITLYHVYNIGSSAAETFQTKLGEIVRKDKLEALAALQDAHQGELTHGNMEIVAARGNAVDLIADRAEKHGYDLICMGAAGESDVSDYLFGNTTLGVVRNASTPILAIPKNTGLGPVKRIVIAADGEGISSPQILKHLVHLAKKREANVIVYHHATKEAPAPDLHPSIAEALQEVSYRYHPEVPDTDDISESIKTFVKKENADLLCLIRRQKRGFFSRLFRENVTRDALFDMDIPLLLVKD